MVVVSARPTPGGPAAGAGVTPGFVPTSPYDDPDGDGGFESGTGTAQSADDSELSGGEEDIFVEEHDIVVVLEREPGAAPAATPRVLGLVSVAPGETLTALREKVLAVLRRAAARPHQAAAQIFAELDHLPAEFVFLRRGAPVGRKQASCWW